VTALHGADSLEAVTVRELKTGETRLLHIPALFIMVGAAPNTEWLSGLVELDDKGFVITPRRGVSYVPVCHLAARRVRSG
jgi:thioredoxin reductase (NADPH)